MIDSHTHLNLTPLSDDIERYLANAKEAGVLGMMIVGTDVQSSQMAIDLAVSYEECFASVGLHPECAESEGWRAEFERIKLLASDLNVSAIGECGLDYSREVDHDSQKELFQMHIDLATHHDLPLIIHCRNTRKAEEIVTWNAYSDLLEILEKQPKLPQFILHCVSGPVTYVQQALKLGAYVSFAGNVTYPSAGAIREILQVVPLDRLLVETDAPFLAPQSHRGSQNEPSYVVETGAFIAKFLNIPFSQLNQKTEENTRRLFS